MRVALSTGWFFPESTGGTEVYVAALAKELKRLGHDVEIGTATHTLPEGPDQYAGIPVYRWNVSGGHDWRAIRGLVPPRGFERFLDWLSRGRFDVYHQHAWTMNCYIHHLRAAQRLGLRCFLTIHVPENTFMRGRYMESTRVVFPTNRPHPLQIPALTPHRLSLLAYETIPGKIGSALGLAGRDLAGWLAVWETADICERVVVVSRWLHDVLVANRYPPERLMICRQGVDFTDQQTPRPEPDTARTFTTTFSESRPMVIGYLGRFTPIKGVDVLCEAAGLLPPDAPIQILLAGPRPSEASDRKFFTRLQKLASRDARIRFAPAISRAQLAQFFNGIDILAVPSRWMETGPLVVMEALAHGVPFLGTARGGLLECWQDAPGCGELVPSVEPRAWAQAIKGLLDHPQKFHQMRAAASALTPRTMSDVAREMSFMYVNTP